jgi:hypothetical protein
MISDQRLPSMSPRQERPQHQRPTDAIFQDGQNQVVSNRCIALPSLKNQLDLLLPERWVFESFQGKLVRE